jgi:hypothetical protein
LIYVEIGVDELLLHQDVDDLGGFDARGAKRAQRAAVEVGAGLHRHLLAGQFGKKVGPATNP